MSETGKEKPVSMTQTLEAILLLQSWQTQLLQFALERSRKGKAKPPDPAAKAEQGLHGTAS